MTYHYTGDGIVYTGSFALTYKKLFVRYKFDKLSVAYDRAAAEKGILKKVFIQRVVLKNVIKSLHKDVVMYVDNLQSMYNERDLLTLKEAEEIVAQAVYVPPNCSPAPEPPAPLPSVYPPNTVLFSLSDAQKGKMKKVVILKSLPKSPQVYEDTLHSLWNENELTDETTAKSLALAYWEARKASIQELLDNFI